MLYSRKIEKNYFYNLIDQNIKYNWKYDIWREKKLMVIIIKSNHAKYYALKLIKLFLFNHIYKGLILHEISWMLQLTHVINFIYDVKYSQKLLVN